MKTTNMAPGIVVVPLELNGPEYAGLTTTFDFRELIGAGRLGEVWRTLIRGTGDWSEHVTKVSFERLESDRVRLAWHGYMSVAAQPPHRHLSAPGILCAVDGRLWLSGELAEGNLADMASGIERHEQLLRFTREAAEGLDYLHSCGLVHNGVKASNVLIVNDRAKLSDFALVCPLGPGINLASVVRYCDTKYLAPEALSGRLCPASDQFALACVYMEARLCGPAFSEWIGRTRPELEAFPPGERAVLEQALAIDPDHRHHNCKAFADALAKSADSRLVADNSREVDS